METHHERMLIRMTELLEVVREIREFMIPQTPCRTLEPQLVDNLWVMDFLQIKRTTFYKHVWRKQLWPVKKIGRREYYDKAEVYALMQQQQAA